MDALFNGIKIIQTYFKRIHNPIMPFNYQISKTLIFNYLNEKNISLEMIFPFLSWGKEVNRNTLKADFYAGLMGAVIVVPQAVAFSIIAGLPVLTGLYTAIVTPIIAALFGSSRHLISGPTTAVSLVIFAALSRFAEPNTAVYIEMAFVMTFMAGVMQLLFGLGRLGMLINFVSHTVVIGFTASAAILIITGQLKNILGIPVKQGLSFRSTCKELFNHIESTNFYVLSIALITLIIGLLSKKYYPKAPNLFIGMVVGTVAAALMVSNGDVHGIKFVGALPSELPSFGIPSLNIENIRKLMPNAFAIALLGLIEATAIARSIALKSGQRIDGNQEFIGQGLSNIVGSLFSCYAGTGSFARSGVNYDSGAQTPLSAVFAALILTVFVLFFAPVAAYLPIPAMASLIILVGWRLIDFHHIKEIQKASKREIIIFFATVVAALFSELELAIYAGVILSLFFYIREVSKPHIAVMAPDFDHPRRQLTNIERKDHLRECPQLKIIRIDGALFFGAMEHISTFVQQVRAESDEKYLLILANGINYIDLDGAEWLVHEAKAWRERDGAMYIAGLKIIAQDVLRDGDFVPMIGKECFYVSKTDAIAAIYKLLDAEICQKCKVRAFKECINDVKLPKLVEIQMSYPIEIYKANNDF
jgi:SulP family sulfate permease